MLQNARFTVATVSALFGENQQGDKNAHTQISY